MVHLDNGILVLEKSELSSLEKTEEPWSYIIKWKKPIWKGFVLYDFNYMTSGEGNTMDSKKISGCHSVGEEGMIGRELGTFRCLKLCLYCAVLNVKYMSSYIRQNL